MNVISLKTTASGTLYTFPAGSVAEVEMIAMEAGTGTLDMIARSRPGDSGCPATSCSR